MPTESLLYGPLGYQSRLYLPPKREIQVYGFRGEYDRKVET